MYPGRDLQGRRKDRITCSQTPGKTLCEAVTTVSLVRGKSSTKFCTSCCIPISSVDLPAVAWESVAPGAYLLL